MSLYKLVQYDINDVISNVLTTVKHHTSQKTVASLVSIVTHPRLLCIILWGSHLTCTHTHTEPHSVYAKLIPPTSVPNCAEQKKILLLVQDGCLHNVTEFSYMVKFCSCVQITVSHNVYESKCTHQQTCLILLKNWLLLEADIYF